MMVSMSGSLQSVTERLFRLKATSVEDGVYETYIQDASIQIIEDSKKTHLWLTCGEPFEDEFIRIDIEGYNLDDLYKLCDEMLSEEFIYGLDQFAGKQLTVSLEGQHSTHPEAQEIEQSVLINDSIEGVMTQIYTQSMYLFESSEKFDKVQSNLNSLLKAHHHALESVAVNQPVPVDTVTATDTHLSVEVDTTRNGDTLTIRLELPNRKNILSHPTTEFLDSHCSGVVENLGQQEVHLTTESGLGDCVESPEFSIRV